MARLSERHIIFVGESMSMVLEFLALLQLETRAMASVNHTGGANFVALTEFLRAKSPST